MSWSEPRLRAALAAPALALSLFQCWYAYLPATEAVAFHHCRFNAHLDCYKSLSIHGAGMEALGVKVLALLTTVYFAMTLLLVGGALANEPRRTGWRAGAAVLAFPAAGLSIFVLLKDWQNAKVTSLSTVLILGLGLALSVLTVARGVSTPSLARTWRSLLAWLVLASLGGFLVQGIGSARLVADEIEIQQEGEPPQLRWPMFAHAIPRVGAAHLGSPTAAREVLLFVNPAEPSSQRLMQAAAKLAPTLGDNVALYFYAPADPRLLGAHRRGQLAKFLLDPARFPPETGTPSAEFERQNEGVEQAGVREFPSVWTREGRRADDVDLAALVESLRRR